MAITEAGRFALAVKLEEMLGEEVAMTLMEHLPPVGWADVATRRDLDVLEREMNHRFEALEHRFDALEHKINATMQEAFAQQTRHLYVAVCTSMLGFGSLVLAAAQLA